MRTWAATLGYDNHTALLQQTLDEEKSTDALLTKLAEQTVNADAESERELDIGTAAAADLPTRSASSRRSGAKATQPPAEDRRP